MWPTGRITVEWHETVETQAMAVYEDVKYQLELFRNWRYDRA